MSVRDLPYTIHIAKALGIDLRVVEICNDDLLKIYSKIVKRGGYEDYIEFRNHVVFL